MIIRSIGNHTSLCNFGDKLDSQQANLALAMLMPLSLPVACPSCTQKCVTAYKNNPQLKPPVAASGSDKCKKRFLEDSFLSTILLPLIKELERAYKLQLCIYSCSAQDGQSSDALARKKKQCSLSVLAVVNFNSR